MKDERPKPSVVTPHGKHCACIGCRAERGKKGGKKK